MKNLGTLLAALSLFIISSFAQASGGGGSSAPVEGPGYLPLKPAFVVNIRDGKRSRFLQVEMQLKLSDMTQGEKILHHDSIIRHTMLMLLSGQEAMDLFSSTGKERLRVKALEGIRIALKSEFKKLPVDDLYFTTFIIQ
ncbi:MAG: flagellar basal body-associated FliL family protein [Sulfuriflexus sp.]|nr:flagellar basal body-associated FliL family protein [Sulfuriflexus sp.]